MPTFSSSRDSEQIRIIKGDLERMREFLQESGGFGKLTMQGIERLIEDIQTVLKQIRENPYLHLYLKSPRAIQVNLKDTLVDLKQVQKLTSSKVVSVSDMRLVFQLLEECSEYLRDACDQILSSEARTNYSDVLLVTVTEVETEAVLNLFPKDKRRCVENRTYFDLGKIGQTAIYMVQAEMGSAGALLTVQEGIRALRPSAVIMVGIAFGLAEGVQRIGDILISTQVQHYEPQRIGDGPEKRLTIFSYEGRVAASSRLLHRLKAAVGSWREPPHIEFGLLLSGDKLVAHRDFRNSLLAFEPKAIGGEMEGAGISAAALRENVDWVIVKAICDWADGRKERDRREHQRLAAENAARFLLHALGQEDTTGSFHIKEEPEYSPLSSTYEESLLPAIQVESPALRLWNVPWRRNTYFTGREAVLEKLHTLLQSSHAMPVAISGLGGIGKTQTAVEYAYRHRDDYRSTLWLRASTPEELAEDYAALARLLHLPEQDEQDRKLVITAAKCWFEHHADWLLIFDNADDLTLLFDYLPKTFRGYVLITTRQQATGAVAMKFEMPLMDEVEGTQLLLRRAGLLMTETSLEQVHPEDRQAARILVKELGGLPLALDQAGAYIEETGESLSGYLQLYREERAELLRRHGRYVTTDHASLATTWIQALQNIEMMHSEAIELMRLCAFFASDAIPEELITDSGECLPPELHQLVTDTWRFNKSIAALHSYSLIQREPTTKTLSVLRLVQAVVQDEMSRTQQQHWAERIVNILAYHFPDNEEAPWTKSQRYLPHALVAVEYIQRWKMDSANAATLLQALGRYFARREQYSDAEPLLRGAVTTSEKYFGTHDLHTAINLDNLASLYMIQAQYEQAEPLYQKALAIYEEHLEADDMLAARCIHQLADLYVEQERYQKALEFYERAQVIYEQQLGPEHPAVATCLYSLADLYRWQRKYEKAVEFYQRALAIYEQQLGPDHQYVAFNLSGLAQSYTLLGQFKEAELHFQRALRIYEQRLGPDYTETAQCLNDFGFLYRSQEKYEEAELLFQRALQIYEQKLGPEHLQTANSLSMLADLYAHQGRYAEAEPLYKRTVAIFEQRLGFGHRNTVDSLQKLVVVYLYQEEYEEAEELLQQALQIYEQKLGPGRPDFVEVRELYELLQRNMRGEDEEK